MSGVRKTFWQVTSRSCGGCSRPRKYGLSGCMPAIVSSVDVSLGGGTSDADGSLRWPLASKNSWNARRISSVVIGRCSLGAADRPVAHDDVALEQAGRLARGGAVDRVGELELEPLVGPDARVAGHAAGHGARAVAELDGVDLGARAVQPRPADGDRARGQRGARADGHAVRRRVLGQHV